jgi:hypothetical protein
LETLELFARDPTADIDLRYNALDAIESNLGLEACRRAFLGLGEVPEFRDYVAAKVSQTAQGLEPG